MTLREWMAREGLKLSEVAEMLGRPVPTVHAWINGHRMPSASAIQQIKRATNGAVTADAMAAQRMEGVS